MYYKLTDQSLQTYNGFKWKLGKWYRIPDNERGLGLCSQSYFHCYGSPLLAILLNSIHAAISNPKLFVVNVRGNKESDNGLKYGFTMMRLVKELPLPNITTIQKVAFAILCAKQVYKDKEWNKWADNWLAGIDRSYHTANAAAADAAYAPAYAAANAADAAAYAAAYNAANAAAADAAYAAADAAAYNAADAANINFVKLAKQAMKY